MFLGWYALESTSSEIKHLGTWYFTIVNSIDSFNICTKCVNTVLMVEKCVYLIGNISGSKWVNTNCLVEKCVYLIGNISGSTSSPKLYSKQSKFIMFILSWLQLFPV